MKKIKLLIASLLIGASAMATCVANFTYVVNPGNNGNVVFTSTSTGTTANTIYFYSFGDGNYSSGINANPNHTYNTGNYYVCLNIIDSTAGCSSSFCDSVHVTNNYPACNANFTATADSVGSNGFTFASTGTGPATTYSWNFGDTTTVVTAPNPHHVYAFDGTYAVCLTVGSTTDTACHDTYCATITVGANTTTCTAFFYVYVDTASGANTVHIINYSTGTNLTYSWTFGDGNTGSDTSSFTYQYANGGNYNICLTVTSATTSCSNTYCDTVTVPSCTVSFTAVTDTSNNTATFTSIVSGSPDTYYWTLGDGHVSIQPNPTYTYASAGMYYVCLNVSSSTNSSCNATYCNYISVGSYCSANFTVIHDSTNLYNYNIYNNASSNSTIISYLWNFGDGTTSPLPYPSHTYANSTPVLLCLTIATSNGCTATYCDSIYPGHSLNQSFTINVIDPATGISVINSTEETLSNYPNPFTNNTTIAYSLNHISAVNLFVMDLLGNTVAVLESGNKQSGNYTLNFDGTSLSSGIYLLQLRLDTKTITKKLVIAK